jgi:hypothetical protein
MTPTVPAGPWSEGSAAELAQRNAHNLAETFQELDAARPDTARRVPSETTVAGWIEQAAPATRGLWARIKGMLGGR